MDEPEEIPPDAQLLRVLFGFMVTKGLSAVASLNVADELEDGPMYYTDLAAAVDADQRALHRVLRMLTSVGIFQETKPGEYANNPVSDLLRTDHPASLRDMAVMVTSDSHWMPWGQLSEVVRSGASGAQHAFGTDLFTWFQRDENREEWQVFNDAMSSFSSGTAQLVVEAYDFSPFRKIVDIGGGHGALLTRVLEKFPEAKGVLFDLPGVVKSATNLGEHVEVVGGDFFESVPKGGDCYTLKHIIHDWSDEHGKRLLGNIAKAMEPAGKVLVIDMVMPESPEPHPAKFMDVNMLTVTEGGSERTEREFTELFSAAGLKLGKIHPTQGPVSVIEAVKA
jgi:hypothetical protein